MNAPKRSILLRGRSQAPWRAAAQPPRSHDQHLNESSRSVEHVNMSIDAREGGRIDLDRLTSQIIWSHKNKQSADQNQHLFLHGMTPGKT